MLFAALYSKKSRMASTASVAIIVLVTGNPAISVINSGCNEAIKIINPAITYGNEDIVTKQYLIVKRIN